MVIWALLLFIAGCVIADTARRYDEKKYDYDPYTFCDFLKEPQADSDARCGHLIGTTVSYDQIDNHVYNLLHIISTLSPLRGFP